MSLFDFLNDPNNLSFDRPAPVQEAPQGPMQAAQPPAPEGLLSQVAAPQKPSFLERFRSPNDDGISWADKLFAIGSTIGGDSGGGMEYLQGKMKSARADRVLQQQQADRRAKNAAFKAAYKNGKFDPGIYASNLGQADVDPSDIAQLTHALAPHMGVDSGYSYTQDSGTGETHWGDQRPISYAEQAAIAREAEAERRNRELEDIAHQNADAHTFTAHKPRASGSAAASWLPPGARVVHVPGS